jgi:hypothetical protein
MSLPTQKYFRIANVPPNWKQDDLLRFLEKIDPSLELKNEDRLSLYPACYGRTQTALLNLCSCTEFFQQLKSNGFSYVRTPNWTDLVIDSHFYDLTLLYSPENEIVAELVWFIYKFSSSR